ncbi:hypothetical protein H4Q26_016574 [Puccinia striiformis f. sp. tritici PST-130]|nr:hypothetical protein Pst134EB_002333 [Puccinia striiformis f. sp. tritici]KAI9625007.1 hypothetical protein H4Q26_016574 [Puccinia striiformis f. sp. tritici PST-130]
MSAPSISVLVSTFHPFPTLSFSLPATTPISKLPRILNPILGISDQSLSTSNGKSIDPHTKGCLSSLLAQNHGFLLFRLVPKILGGKGGFGSQLRAAGGRMSSQKTQNNDSCRDLSGRRLSTIKEAQKLAAAIAAEPERQLAKRKEAEERLEGLKKEIERLDHLVNGTDEQNLKKRRLNDNHLLTQSKEGIEKVRNATALAMLKKKNKQKKLADSSTRSSIPVIIEDKEDANPSTIPVKPSITVSDTAQAESHVTLPSEVQDSPAKVEGLSVKGAESSAKVEEPSAKVEESPAKVEELSATIDGSSATAEESAAKVEELAQSSVTAPVPEPEQSSTKPTKRNKRTVSDKKSSNQK